MKTARLFHCSRCYTQVRICSSCDRGQRYCSRDCSQSARQQSLQRASKKYRESYQGRLKNAERQRRFRQRQNERLREAEKKVTHQGSAARASNDSLYPPVNPLSVVSKLQQDAQENTVIRCDFCESACDAFLRRDFLPPPLRHRA